ncbi:MAG: PaaI family thioesterase [Rhodospirillales bacterium]|nr:PaaI family thioesterase [Rhodospirillales bacterium]
MSNISNKPLTLETLRGHLKHSPFAVLLNAQVISCEDGKVELSVAMKKELTQHHGFAHGAIVGAIADNACAWAAASVVGDVVTSEYKVNLLAPAIGERLIGRGEVVRAGRRQVTCRSDVFAVNNGVEKIVATALATIAVVEQKVAA